jgi:hypothetical protein
MRSILTIFMGLLLSAAMMSSLEARAEKTNPDTDSVFYSIHLASFKDLQRANRYVNSLKKEGNDVFWMNVETPGEGRFYRVYSGKFDSREDAVEYWKTLQKEGSVSYFGVHLIKKPAKPADSPPMPVAKEQAPSKLLYHKDRFVDNRDGTVTDLQTNLMWVQNGWRLDLFAAATWSEAVRKCEEFSHAGYTDWHLPTIEQWLSLIDTHGLSPSLVEPNPFNNMIVHMPYWSQSDYIYDSRYPLTTVSPVHAYTVNLYYGHISPLRKSDRAFIFPVRARD